MSLLEEIEKCWEEKRVKDDAAKWALALIESKDKVIQAGKQFRKTEPLRAYISVSRATKPSISFSLRYQGQEVAVLSVKEKGRIVKVSQKTEEYFGVKARKREFKWDDPEATEFRRAFKKLPLDKKRKEVTEHHIESKFLKQMARSEKGKSKNTLRNIQPILFEGFPLQFPLPISGNTGKPESTRGNMDILARRGVGKGTRISLWELKKPATKVQAKKNAIKQAYIYAVTLIKVLRSKSGSVWYNEILGFSGAIPQKLTIESVVAVSFKEKNERMDFVEDFRKFKNENALQIGSSGDVIKLYVAHYNYEPKDEKTPLTVEMQEI